jgi:hypothetical protein
LIALVFNDALRNVLLADVEGKSIVVGINVRRRTIAADAGVGKSILSKSTSGKVSNTLHRIV